MKILDAFQPGDLIQSFKKDQYHVHLLVLGATPVIIDSNGFSDPISGIYEVLCLSVKDYTGLNFEQIASFAEGKNSTLYKAYIEFRFSKISPD